MKALLLTNEYPPHIYGGAGVHVDYLTRELSKLCALDVRCFGDQKFKKESLSVTGFGLDDSGFNAPKPLKSVFGAFQRCLNFNTAGIDADIVHVHTWYTHLGGVLAKLTYSIPLVVTTHSLEPLRPWKREQLAGGYDASSWIEKTVIEMADAVIAVSSEAKKDILKYFKVDPARIHVIHNGIDLDEYRPTSDAETLSSYGIDPGKPFILFVGRITRQKGIIHLVRAIEFMDKDFQIVLCAGAPDTPEIAHEMTQRVAEVQKKREGVVWIQQMVDNRTKIVLYSHADAFVCPSVYEPFGIINLEAMACETAVIATDTGGIKEVVSEGETGLLVPIDNGPSGALTPENAGAFEKDLAEKINLIMKEGDLRTKMGKAGRNRALKLFSWAGVAQKTYDLYKSLTNRSSFSP